MVKVGDPFTWGSRAHTVYRGSSYNIGVRWWRQDTDGENHQEGSNSFPVIIRRVRDGAQLYSGIIYLPLIQNNPPQGGDASVEGSLQIPTWWETGAYELIHDDTQYGCAECSQSWLYPDQPKKHNFVVEDPSETPDEYVVLSNHNNFPMNVFFEESGSRSLELVAHLDCIWGNSCIEPIPYDHSDDHAIAVELCDPNTNDVMERTNWTFLATDRIDDVATFVVDIPYSLCNQQEQWIDYYPRIVFYRQNSELITLSLTSLTISVAPLPSNDQCAVMPFVWFEGGDRPLFLSVVGYADEMDPVNESFTRIKSVSEAHRQMHRDYYFMGDADLNGVISYFSSLYSEETVIDVQAAPDFDTMLNWIDDEISGPWALPEYFVLALRDFEASYYQIDEDGFLEEVFFVEPEAPMNIKMLEDIQGDVVKAWIFMQIQSERTDFDGTRLGVSWDDVTRIGDPVYANKFHSFLVGGLTHELGHLAGELTGTGLPGNNDHFNHGNERADECIMNDGNHWPVELSDDPNFTQLGDWQRHVDCTGNPHFCRFHLERWRSTL